MPEVFIASIKKRGFLRQVAEGSKSTASTLGEALLAVQKTQFTDSFSRGRLLVSTSGNGQSGSFNMALPSTEWTQDNVFALVEELIEILESVITDSGTVDDADPANTTALFQAMIQTDALRGIRQQMGDFTGLNWPNFTR